MLRINRCFRIFLLFFVVCGLYNELTAQNIKHNNTLYHGKGAKYIFLFIGDGMGSMQCIAASEAFKTEKQARLLMNTLPVKAYVNTSPYGKGTTDSAAAATAMACGIKTRNHVLGLDHEGKSIESVAEMAKKLGWKIAIISSVPLNHATPAAFYAHRLKRYMYNGIIQDLAASNFDYFGGGSFMIKAKTKRREVLQVLKDRNYIMIESPGKMPELELNKKYIVYTNLPYVIDRNADSGLSLADFTRLGLKHIYRGSGKTKGFFMMVEGGRIDWSAHANDGSGMIREVKDLDNALKVALDFYKKHPKSTSIIVAADHETGALHFLPNAAPAKLLQQKQSYAAMSAKLREYKKQKLPFEKVLPLLQANYGIKKFSPEELKKLRKSWIITKKIKTKDGKNKIKITYGAYRALLRCMQRIFNIRCGLKWTRTGHSPVAVPLTAIGVGAEIFAGYYENTQIARKLKSLIKAVPEK